MSRPVSRPRLLLPACGGGVGLSAITLLESLRGPLDLVGADSDRESWAAHIVDEFHVVLDIGAARTSTVPRSSGSSASAGSRHGSHFTRASSRSPPRWLRFSRATACDGLP
jgi:hypothetical protein